MLGHHSFQKRLLGKELSAKETSGKEPIHDSRLPHDKIRVLKPECRTTQNNNEY